MINPKLPRVDLHRHLEGSVRLTTVLEIAKQHLQTLPSDDLDGLKKAVFVDAVTTDILKLFPRFDILRSVFVDYATCKRVTRECMEDASRDGIDYLELRFSPLFMAEPHGLDPLGVTSAVCDAWDEARERFPVTSRLMGILSRTYGPEGVEIELDAALAYRDRGIVGLDLAGDEARHPARQFTRHFARARDAGLLLTAHAGEFAGAESIRETIASLSVQRLGHAVHACDDPAVLDLIVEKRIAIECCPTSNLYTGSVASLRSHPLPRFIEAGIPVSICTDDPTLFGELKLEDEYRLVQENMGLNGSQMDQIQKDSLKTAFISQSEKEKIFNRITARADR